jgi:hypothetical protein
MGERDHNHTVFHTHPPLVVGHLTGVKGGTKLGKVKGVWGGGASKRCVCSQEEGRGATRQRCNCRCDTSHRADAQPITSCCYWAPSREVAPLLCCCRSRMQCACMRRMWGCCGNTWSTGEGVAGACTVRTVHGQGVSCIPFRQGSKVPKSLRLQGSNKSSAAAPSSLLKRHSGMYTGTPWGSALSAPVPVLPCPGVERITIVAAGSCR